MRTLLAALLLCFSIQAEDWQAHFAKIPINTTSFRAHLTPPVDLVLTNFRPTSEIRAVVLMPGASDRLYFYDWGEVKLPQNPTLLDAITALTNAADLRVFIVPPFLLLGMSYDNPNDPLTVTPPAKSAQPARKIRGRTYFLDRPYDRLLPIAEKFTKLKFIPKRTSVDSWHYYRLSFVGYDLSSDELLRALAYGTKTTVAIDRKRARFTELKSVH